MEVSLFSTKLRGQRGIWNLFVKQNIRQNCVRCHKSQLYLVRATEYGKFQKETTSSSNVDQTWDTESCERLVRQKDSKKLWQADDSRWHSKRKFSSLRQDTLRCTGTFWSSKGTRRKKGILIYVHSTQMQWEESQLCIQKHKISQVFM